MKKLYTLLASIALFASGSLLAQTHYNVNVSNNVFSPSQLEINVGDTVVWTNSLGFHNVNGNAIDFPNNPDSFGNETGPAGWTYEFVFTIAGTYSYRCDVHEGMTGSVIVSASTVGITEAEKPAYFAFFPNPVVNQLSWKWNDNTPLPDANMTIYDTQGRKVAEFLMNGISSHDVSGYSEGLYTFVLTQENEQIQTGKILINR
ncbi:T9SS type A sorting domain-containing protein [Cryomorpha ignava]|uniref:T9SS type A sorting domain-containing protein n=1 Tax=Cryomorpha ignava TaxID=101383 RepID=A0A7K3WQ77_9FLAO|nr:T9SS type A sorting domain-containing protein [Cryomorpha ignava]NEN23706.1 T9SS type A sorting domain-containing protein [Cryomorpha ignava]